VPKQDFTTGEIFPFSLLMVMTCAAWQMLGRNSALSIMILSIPRGTHSHSFLDFTEHLYQNMIHHAENENHPFLVISHKIQYFLCHLYSFFRSTRRWGHAIPLVIAFLYCSTLLPFEREYSF
jgi:hypothetical protein